MKLQLDTHDLGCMIEELSDIAVSPEREQRQQSIPILGGTAQMQRILLRKGMEINLYEGKFLEPVTLDVGVRYPHLEISYTLSGQGCWETAGSPRSYHLAPGVSNLVYIQDTKLRVELLPQERSVHMELRVDVRYFSELLPELARMSNEPFFCRQTAGSPHISHIVEQMKQCPYSGRLQKLYLEGKAYELLACQLDAAEKEEERIRAASKLKADDIQCLHQAREILSRTWKEPPGLLELARLVGLNDYKLKLGFKELFGTTVFGYVRGLRMNEARKILEQGEANVSEAATMVGYHNLSHFASLFRKTFGYNPSEFVRTKEVQG
ncbi:helix-turn-helix transcriptional regulator [Brevibacillus borstelensis]|uniref:helix-turn-helix transcriptional regulator n=1 Tax=Brevibacillus borstelensis TaxID=45462 RepID=UPI0030BF8DD5